MNFLELIGAAVCAVFTVAASYVFLLMVLSF
jgi:hypothetical protein